MLCEMCGKEVPATTRIRLGRTVLAVGPECAKFGPPVDPPPPVPPSESSAGRRPLVTTGVRAAGGGRRMEERDLYREIGELELAPDWNKRVRVAREARTWTPEVLGKKLNEKKSVVLKIESGSFHPPDALVRKLEHLLQIRLRAEPEPPATG
jgi:putative transcription factor